MQPGVVQGGLVSPVQFILHVNDMPTSFHLVERETPCFGNLEGIGAGQGLTEVAHG
jgi:hypothetical protein